MEHQPNHRYMLTCNRVLTCSGGLIEGVQTRPAAHTGVSLTGVTDSSSRGDGEKHTSTTGRLGRDGNIDPDRSLKTQTSAACHKCTEDPRTCDASLLNQERKQQSDSISLLPLSSQFNLGRTTRAFLW